MNHTIRNHLAANAARSERDAALADLRAANATSRRLRNHPGLVGLAYDTGWSRGERPRIAQRALFARRILRILEVNMNADTLKLAIATWMDILRLDEKEELEGVTDTTREMKELLIDRFETFPQDVQDAAIVADVLVKAEYPNPGYRANHAGPTANRVGAKYTPVGFSSAWFVLSVGLGLDEIGRLLDDSPASHDWTPIVPESPRPVLTNYRVTETSVPGAVDIDVAVGDTHGEITVLKSHDGTWGKWGEAYHWASDELIALGSDVLDAIHASVVGDDCDGASAPPTCPDCDRELDERQRCGCWVGSDD